MNARLMSAAAALIALAALGVAVFQPLATPVAAPAQTQDDDFGPRVRAYLLENPQVLSEVVAALEAQEDAAQAVIEAEMLVANADALFNDPNDWVGGNPDGDVTIVEFLDYRCGFCRRAHPEIDALVAQDPNIRLVIKEFPILGEESVLASRFALSARFAFGDDAYKAIHDALMSVQGPISATSLARVAQNANLDAQTIFEGIEDRRVTEMLMASRSLAQALQINGTPAFALQDRVLRGYLPLDAMQAVVDEVRGG
ncbi:MAG: DsbA family protein [Pseudomonadota bacterium]